MNFRIKQKGAGFKTRMYPIASATEIKAGDIVGVTSQKVVKAGAATTAIAYAINGSAVGETLIEVTEGNDFTLVGTGDAVYADNMKGSEVDLVVSGTKQLIDVGSSTTDVFEMVTAADAGVVGSAENIEVKINKPITF